MAFELGRAYGTLQRSSLAWEMAIKETTPASETYSSSFPLGDVRRPGSSLIAGNPLLWQENPRRLSRHIVVVALNLGQLVSQLAGQLAFGFLGFHLRQSITELLLLLNKRSSQFSGLCHATLGFGKVRF